ECWGSMGAGGVGGEVVCVYFIGVTFIVAGIAVLIGVCARLAAALSALQMGMFFVLVWIPAMATRPLSKFQWGEVVVTWVLTAAGWVVADSYRGIPWLGPPSLLFGGGLGGAHQRPVSIAL